MKKLNPKWQKSSFVSKKTAGTSENRALCYFLSVQTAETLPRWDLSNVFPSLESEEFQKSFAEIPVLIKELGALFDKHNVTNLLTHNILGSTQYVEGIQDYGTVNHIEEVDIVDFSKSFDEVSQNFEKSMQKIKLITLYLSVITSTDSKNELAKAKYSELQTVLTDLEILSARFSAWVGSVDVKQLILHSSNAKNMDFAIIKTAQSAKYLLDTETESLLSSLKSSSVTAWHRLFHDLTSQTTAIVPLPDGEKELPIAAIQNMAYSSDKNVRKIGYETELKIWPTIATSLAAAMNSIKGYVNVVSKKRGFANPLEPSLHTYSIDSAILQAMQNAYQKKFPQLRKFYKMKANLLGYKAGLPWYERFSEIGTTKNWSYQEAKEFILENFGTYSKELRGFAERAYNGWIDAEPRPGKVGGGFCVSMGGDESRILVNFDSSFESVITIAHELGHAYHNYNLKDRFILERMLNEPMTLAETASTFCETIVNNAILQNSSNSEKLAVLNNVLQAQVLTILDIHSRFLFENWVFEKRKERELSVDELCELMKRAQKESYGDSIDENHLQPYAWAGKPHYYSQMSFYNYPYTFGLLFGLGLYAHYQKNPDEFRGNYNNLLSHTSSKSPEELATYFDIDIYDEVFWDSSLNIIINHIEEFERLAQK